MRKCCLVLFALAFGGCSGATIQEAAVTTTTAPVSPTVTVPPSTVPPITAPSTTVRATRSKPTVPVPKRITPGTQRPGPQIAPSMDAAFWRRLANCESPTGRSGYYKGYFQFGPDTARKVGWYEGASYEAQVAMAQRWLAMIGGPSKGGTRSGWPHCWWVALRG